MFSLSKINVSVIQASLVEETIPFSALDHIQELACVSTLAVCLDNITCQVRISNVHHSKMCQEGRRLSFVYTIQLKQIKKRNKIKILTASSKLYLLVYS